MKRVKSARGLLMALLGLATAAVTVGLAGPADSATVLNRFERSCYAGCSPYVQTNGRYVASIASTCVTKTWWGRTTSYNTPPYSPCR